METMYTIGGKSNDLTAELGDRIYGIIWIVICVERKYGGYELFRIIQEINLYFYYLLTFDM